MIYQKRNIPDGLPSCQGFGWVYRELRELEPKNLLVSEEDREKYRKVFEDTNRRMDEYLEKRMALKRSK